MLTNGSGTLVSTAVFVLLLAAVGVNVVITFRNAYVQELLTIGWSPLFAAMVIARSVLSDPHPHIMSFSFLSLVLPQRLRSGSRGLRQRVRRICTLRPSPHRSLGQRRVHLRVAHLDRVALVLDGALRRRLGHALRDHESGPLCLPRLCLDHGTGTGHAHVRPGVRCGRLRPGASASPLSLNLPSSWSDLSHKLQVALALALGYFVTLLLWKWDYDPDGTPLPTPLP